jgi:hypothetical protein
MSYRVSIVIVLGLVIVPRLSLSQQKAVKASPPKPIAAVLSWLPADTESVIVAKGPLPSKEDTGIDYFTEVDGLGVREYGVERDTGRVVPPPPSTPFSSIMAEANTGLFSEISGPDKKPLELPKILWTLQAGRKFGQIEKIPGCVSYEGCDLAIFEKDVPVTLVDAIKKLSTRVTQAGSFRAYEVIAKDGRKDVPLYFAQPAANVLVAATHLGFLETLLKRVDAQPKEVAFPAHLPEWKYVDTAAPAWGIRHFRSKAADAEAIGITFSVTPKDSAIVFHYFPRAGTHADTFRKMLEELSGQEGLTMKSIAGGAVQASWQLHERRSSASNLIVLWLMGWVVAL